MILIKWVLRFLAWVLYSCKMISCPHWWHNFPMVNEKLQMINVGRKCKVCGLEQHLEPVNKMRPRHLVWRKMPEDIKKEGRALNRREKRAVADAAGMKKKKRF